MPFSLPFAFFKPFSTRQKRKKCARPAFRLTVAHHKWIQAEGFAIAWAMPHWRALSQKTVTHGFAKLLANLQWTVLNVIAAIATNRDNNWRPSPIPRSIVFFSVRTPIGRRRMIFISWRPHPRRTPLENLSQGFQREPTCLAGTQNILFGRPALRYGGSKRQRPTHCVFNHASEHDQPFHLRLSKRRTGIEHGPSYGQVPGEWRKHRVSSRSSSRPPERGTAQETAA